MSENLTSLARRKGLDDLLFSRLNQNLSKDGSDGADPALLDTLAEEFRIGTATVLGAESFYDFLGAKNAAKEVYLCNGTACKMAGTQDALAVTLGKHFSPDKVGEMCCLGRCHENSAFHYRGKNYSAQPLDKLGSLFAAEDQSATESATVSDVDQYTVTSLLAEPHLLTATSDDLSPADFAKMNYAPLGKMFARGAAALLAEIKTSKLRGRGGAGFPVSTKWAGCRAASGVPKFIVCNADEGDPGAYSDRYLLEQQPHAVLFGMLIAGFITGAEVGVLYIRAEYPASIARVEAAIQEAVEAGAVGKNIFGSDFSYRFKIARGAGAYICGEETALLASIEGQRPEVRLRPPFPVEAGLFGKPTVVNNVETFACIRPLLQNGGAAYAAIGTPASTGTKLLSLDSAFQNPGVYEVAMGTPLRQVIDELGGGFRKSVKALHIGGPLGGLVPVAKIDALSVDFESFRAAGFLLGHGSIVSIPEDYPLLEYLRHLFAFTAAESCGKCFPCRLGSTRGEELLAAAQQSGTKIDRVLFADLLETLEVGSLCALGGGLPLPVRNALEHFPAELAPYFSE